MGTQTLTAAGGQAAGQKQSPNRSAPADTQAASQSIGQAGQNWPSLASRTPAAAPPKPEGWSRLQVYANGMDEAALVLAGAKLTFTNAQKSHKIFIGMDPHFVKVYDENGRALGTRIALKEEKGRTFRPGVYVVTKQGHLIALTIASDNATLGLEPGRSTFTDRPLTAKEKIAQAEEEEKAGAEARDPAAPPSETFDVGSMLVEPGRFQAMIASAPDAQIFGFVPAYNGGSGKGGGESKTLYASPIEGRGDGEAANEPPWPVSLQGPKLVSVDSDATFTAKVDWAANGNYTVSSQVFSQLGESIQYQWELFDITRYAKQQLAKDPAATRDDPAAKPEKTLDERIEDFKTSQAGTGGGIASGSNREFKREFADWWKDTKRAHRDAKNPSGDTVGERLSHTAANLTTLELAPVSLLITSLGASLKWLASALAGPNEQKEVPLKQEGIFLVRVITTPTIHKDGQGKRLIRPPSVAVKVVEVTKMDTAVRESLDEQDAQLAELQTQIDLADEKGNRAKAEYLRSLLAKKKKQIDGSTGDLLAEKIGEMQAEIDQFRKDHPHLSVYSRQREVDALRDQLVMYVHHEQERAQGMTGLPSEMKRVNATLVSEVTGQPYPLLISAGPMARQGAQHQWMISDVTNREGEAYTGLGNTPSAAFRAALEKFGKKAAYGRGRIGARTAGLGLEDGADKEMLVDSEPADWAIAEKRLDDLTTLLAALGLFVATAGTGAAILGAALAARRLIKRWQSGDLSLDDRTVGDLLGVFGGIGVAGELAAGLRIQRFEKAFAILGEAGASEEGIATAAKALEGAQQLAKGVAMANEAIGYAGVVWGNIQFIDGMMAIAEQERSGALTHAGARRARAEAISSAVQNNGLFIAGNVLKARAANKAREEPTGKKTAPNEKLPPGEKPSPDYVPPEGDRPAQRTGEPVPLGERRATPEEIKAALSADLRDMLVPDKNLEGNDVQVEYAVDPDTKLITDIRIRYSPDVRPSMVAVHEQTVRTMQKYQGFAGRVRRALSWVADVIHLDTLKPENKALFEAALEVQKLPKAIVDQMEHMRKLDPNARALAEAELDHLELQLDQHMRTLGREEAGEGAGYVAAKGLSKAKQKQYADLKAQLRDYAPGSDEHEAKRWEMYELIGGDLPFATWEKVYAGNVDRANKANASVKAEHARLGWGEPEQTIQLGKGEVRRLDIADRRTKRGVEVKKYETGKIYASEDIVWEVTRDAKLVKRGWDITWVMVDTEPSGPLLDMLRDAGIRVDIRESKGKGDSVRETLYPVLPNTRPG